MTQLALSLLLVFFMGGATAQTHSPYAAQHDRALKALSEEEIRQYLAGAGMGYGRAAELNGFPGPMHVLELADKLELGAEQREATRRLMESHKADARAIGERRIEAEKRLDAIFRSGKVDEKTLAEAVRAAAALEGDYRLSHLETHRRMRLLLTDEQAARYERARGYASGAGHAPGKHRSAAPAADETPSIVSGRPIAVAAAPGATHSLRLSLYVFRDTRWSQADIEAAVVRAARLLSQCGVGIEPAELHVVEAPPRFRVYSTPVSRALLRALKVRKPAVFFVEGTRNDPPYDAEAVGRGNSASRPELADTVWIAYGARDLPQVLAHELVHVLSDGGAHSDEPQNLMAEETSAQNTRLSAAQCERARARGKANGLLAP